MSTTLTSKGQVIGSLTSLNVLPVQPSNIVVVFQLVFLLFQKIFTFHFAFSIIIRYEGIVARGCC